MHSGFLMAGALFVHIQRLEHVLFVFCVRPCERKGLHTCVSPPYGLDEYSPHHLLLSHDNGMQDILAMC